MDEKEKIIQVLIEYEKAGLIDKDHEKVCAYLTDDIIGIGIGEQGFVTSKQDIRDVILREIREEDHAHYGIEIDQAEVTVHADTAQLCAKINITKANEGTESRSVLLQSVSLRLVQGEWKICALHASSELLSLETIESYPLKYAEKTLAQLKASIQTETINLMSQSLSGGVMGTYFNENKYPLYFINDSMLDYLGYSRKEFCDKFQEDVFQIVYKADRSQVAALIQNILQTSSDYGTRFRVYKKDGSILWMEERVRRGMDEQGNDILIGVFVDVTELITLQERLEEQAEELEAQTEELRAQTEELEIQTEGLRIQKKKLEQNTMALEISEERFRIAFEKTSNTIFDYDFASGTIIHSGARGKSADYSSIGEIRNILFADGEITDSTVGELESAFSAVRNGQEQAVCIVKVVTASGREAWYRISLSGIADGNGCAVRAVGLIEDITAQKETEIAFSMEEQYRKAVLADVVAAYVINFTGGILESCQVECPGGIAMEPGQRYTELIEKLVSGCFSGEEEPRCREMFSWDNVIKRYEKGESECSLEYRAVCPDGTYRWVLTKLHLVLDSVTNEVKGFMYVMDIDKMKQKELDMTRKLERDPMTGIFNKGAAVSHIEEKLKFPVSEHSVFLMLDVDHFKGINDTYGHPAGDKVLSKVAEVLTEHFCGNDVIGRLGGDEFCVFINRDITPEEVGLTAEKVCRDVRSILEPQPDKPGLSCSIGITLCDSGEASFERIYQEADIALYTAKKEGRDQFSFFR